MLNGPETRLLILDNAEDEKAIQAWIPRQGGCRTIVTSRFSAWSAAVETLRIYVLDPEPARELLLSRAGRDATPANQAAADAVAERLQYLPLALEQAAAFVHEQGDEFGFEDYLRLYADGKADLLAMGVLGSTEYPDSVVSTWRVTVERLSARARGILRLSAFLAPAPIPVEMLLTENETLPWKGSEFGEEESAPWTELAARQAVGELARYSMATAGGQAYSVHRLVGAVERMDTKEVTRDRWQSAALDLVSSYLPEQDAGDVRTWPRMQVLEPHGMRLVAALTGEALVKRLPHLMNALAVYFLALARFPEAEPLMRRALEIFTSSLGPDHPHTQVIRRNLEAFR